MKSDKQEETRERILDSAEGLIGRLSFPGMSMRALSEHMGVSRKTLYNHFPGGKREIWKGCIERKILEYSSRLLRIVEDTGRDYVERGRDLLDIGREAMAVFYGPGGLTNTGEEERYVIPEVRSRLVEALSHFFDEGRNRGFIRKDLPVLSLSLVLVTLISDWGMRDSCLGEGEVDTLPEFVERVMFDGILSEEGRKRAPEIVGGGKS
jgi:AcrR family transcriptional regulator